MDIRCVVACHDSNGPNMYFVKVKCNVEQYKKGLHYEAAEGYISENYEVSGPFWICDENDACGVDLCQRMEWDWDETYVDEAYDHESEVSETD